MPRRSKTKPQERRFPATIEDASDFQLLRVFGRPKTWAVAGIKRVELRVTSRRCGRPSVESGFFDFLPLEILDTILLNLDYVSLARLCMTNWKVECYIKKQPFYKLVVEYGQTALRQLKTWDLLHVHTAGQMYAILNDPECSTPECTGLGDSLFFPTCRRACPRCLGKKPLCSLIGVETAQRIYGLNGSDIIENLSCFRLPDTRQRGPASASRTKPELAVVDSDVRELSVRLLGKELSKPRLSHIRDQLVAAPFPYRDPESKETNFGRHCFACYEQYIECRDIWSQIEIEPSMLELERWRNQVKELEGPGLAIYGTKQLLAHIRDGKCSGAWEVWRQRNRTSG